jgi:DNA-binding MarR family transcriptional regulator
MDDDLDLIARSDAAAPRSVRGAKRRGGETEKAAPPRPRRKAIELDAFIPYRMSLLSHRMTLSVAELDVDDARLTVQEWRVLSIIAESGPLIPADIRRHGTQDKSTISWAIKRLEQRGFLLRQSRSRDARTFEVLLSDRGWDWYLGRKPIAEGKSKAILSRLTREERDELARLINKLDEPDRSER